MKQFTRACDGLVLASLVGVIVGAPLAFGSVHRVSFLGLELIALALLGVWALKIAIAGPPAGDRPRVPGWLLGCGAALLALPLAQLLPLPVAILEVVSPNAAEIQARAGVGDGFRPLSLAPPLTIQLGLKVGAYLALLSVVLLYPWNGGEGGERRVERALFRALLCAGGLVAVLALLQRVTWNGHMLWFFIPYDWPGGLPDPRPRTGGPFINRNHFAGYMAMLLPLSVAGAIGKSWLDDVKRPLFSRVIFGVVASLMALALLMSLSRGGWLAGGAGVLVLFTLLRAHLPRSERPRLLRRRRTRRLVLGGALAVLAGLAFVPLGSRTAGGELDARLAQTVTDETSVEQRVGWWRTSVAMALDFPLTGVGLGAWRDVALRYDRTVRDGTPAREAHNDLLQLLAEAGLPGALLVLGGLGGVLTLLWCSLSMRSTMAIPLVAAGLAGAIASLLHVLVDFDLQIPAVVVGLMVLLGTSLRRALPRSMRVIRATGRTRSLAGGAALALAGAVAVVLAQPETRVDLALGESAEDARRFIAARPASPRGHLALYGRLAAAGEATPDRRREVLEVAQFLAPREPLPLDALAIEEARAGREDEALAFVERSVRLAPRTDDHAYLTPKAIEALSPREVGAIERGLGAALGEHPDAGRTLAEVMVHRGRSNDAAAVWTRLARNTDDPALQHRYLVEGASAFSRAQRPGDASAMLRRALQVQPGSTAAYARLIRLTGHVVEPQVRAPDLARQGISAGADPTQLWMAAADAAALREDADAARDAIERALRHRPAHARAHFQLGLLELGAGRPAFATRALARATQLAPHEPAYWFHLGRAERSRYRFSAARRAFDRVLEIDPDHRKAKAQLRALASRMAMEPRSHDREG